MEKRIILAIALSAIVLIVFPYILPSPTPPPKDQQAEQPVQSAGKEEVEGKPLPMTEVVEVAGKVDKEERFITVETDLYKVVFTTRGGKVKRWELKQYWVDLKKTNNIVLFDPGDIVVGAYPMAVNVGDRELNKLLQGGLFRVEGRDLYLSDRNPEGSITLSYVNPQSGRGIKKIFTFYHNSYRVDIEILPINIDGSYTVSTGSNFGITSWGEKRMVGFVGPATMVDSKVKKDKVAKIKGPVYYEGNIRWTAIQDKYFMSALVPLVKGTRVIVRKKTEKDVYTEIEVINGQKSSFMLYAGPKEYNRLKGLGVGLEHSIPFGWFIFGELPPITWMAKGLFYLLQFFYGLTRNYGISIILLTAVVRVVFVPLAFKSFKSMKEMQKLQPEMQKLQKKHKGDKAELNKAMMELYKTKKVNPLGGCLPMVLQLPVFIGLYNLLGNTIELRHTPFMLWITDLSGKDPYYVMPIIMGITMLIQQKTSPSSADPRQAKMMLFMPVIFTFFFLNFPSGLVLYWLVNNVLTIAQQYVTTKYVYK